MPPLVVGEVRPQEAARVGPMACGAPTRPFEDDLAAGDHALHFLHRRGLKARCIPRLDGCQDAVQLPELTYVDNDDYATTGELYSLHLALEETADQDEALVVSYGDVRNNHAGAPMIWDDLAKRHGFSSSPYVLSDMKGLEALWGSIGNGKLDGGPLDSMGSDKLITNGSADIRDFAAGDNILFDDSDSDSDSD